MIIPLTVGNADLKLLNKSEESWDVAKFPKL